MTVQCSLYTEWCTLYSLLYTVDTLQYTADRTYCVYLRIRSLPPLPVVKLDLQTGLSNYLAQVGGRGMLISLPRAGLNLFLAGEMEYFTIEL